MNSGDRALLFGLLCFLALQSIIAFGVAAIGGLLGARQRHEAIVSLIKERCP